MDSKVCVKCNIEKPIEMYYFRKDTLKYRGTCNTCYKGYEGNRTLLSRRLKQEFENGIRTCTKCNITKTLSEYHKDKYNTNGYTVICKTCKALYNIENRDNICNTRLIYEYGITLADYNTLLEQQDNKCAICKTTTPLGRNNKFHVDHCHTTGKVRGLLCHHCNVALGSMFDNISYLKSAIEYLENNK